MVLYAKTPSLSVTKEKNRGPATDIDECKDCDYLCGQNTISLSPSDRTTVERNV